MGKRQQRIRRLSPETLAPWYGSAVDVIDKNGRAHHGQLLSADDVSLTLQDQNHALEWFDGRHTHRLVFEELLEVWVSYWSAW